MYGQAIDVDDLSQRGPAFGQVLFRVAGTATCRQGSGPGEEYPAHHAVVASIRAMAAMTWSGATWWAI